MANLDFIFFYIITPLMIHTSNNKFQSSVFGHTYYFLLALLILQTISPNFLLYSKW